MQCQNIRSVVDKKSEIVLLEDSASNFDRYCLKKSIIVSAEYTELYSAGGPSIFSLFLQIFGLTQRRTRKSRGHNTTLTQPDYQWDKTDGRLYSMQREERMTSVSAVSQPS